MSSQVLRSRKSANHGDELTNIKTDTSGVTFGLGRVKHSLNGGQGYFRGAKYWPPDKAIWVTRQSLWFRRGFKGVPTQSRVVTQRSTRIQEMTVC
jgi:hypothetical protein